MPAPFNRSGYGTVAGLESLCQEKVRAAWARRARPGGTVIGMAGNIEPERARDMMEGLLSGWSGIADEPTQTRPAHRGAHLWAAQVMEVLLANLPHLQRAAPDFLQALQADLALAKATEEAICAYSGWNVSQLQRHDWHAELTRHLHPPSPPWLNALPLVLALLLGVGLLARRHPQARLSAA
jgi:hypothetical protein